MKPLSTETLLKLQRRMFKHASSRRHPRAEDIAADYVVRLLEGYHQSATIGQAYIDICRLTSGRFGQPGYEDKKRLNMVATEDVLKAAEFNEPQVEGLSQDELLDLEKVCTSIKCKKSRKVFSYLLQGLNQQEIAVKLKLTPGRINQIVSRQLEELYRKYGRD